MKVSNIFENLANEPKPEFENRLIPERTATHKTSYNEVASKVDTQATSLSNRKSSQGVQLRSLSERTAVLETSQDELASKVDAQATSIHNLKSSQNDNMTSIFQRSAMLEMSQDEVLSMVDDQATSLSNLKFSQGVQLRTIKRELASKVDAQEVSINNLKSSQNDKTTSISNRTTILETSQDELSNKVDAQATSINNLKSSQGVWLGSISKRTAALTMSQEELASKCDAQAMSISNLKSSQNNNVTSLFKHITMLEASQDDLLSKVDAQANSVGDLNLSHVSMLDGPTNLEHTSNKLEREIEGQSANYVALSSQNRQLELASNYLQNKLVTLSNVQEVASNNLVLRAAKLEATNTQLTASLSAQYQSQDHKMKQLSQVVAGLAGTKCSLSRHSFSGLLMSEETSGTKEGSNEQVLSELKEADAIIGRNIAQTSANRLILYQTFKNEISMERTLTILSRANERRKTNPRRLDLVLSQARLGMHKNDSKRRKFALPRK